MLSPLAYHCMTNDFFKSQTDVWQSFIDPKHKEEQLLDFKLNLLKNSYKFDEATDKSLYQKVAITKEALGLFLPVTLYQAQHTEEVNATIAYLNREAHIVFSGRILQLLTEDEQLAVISHELSHVHLFMQLNGDIEVTDRIITAIGNHTGSTPAHYETARLFKLYTEIFCDRGAYLATKTYQPIITSLVKIATGLQTVNADSYIKQAEEIFATDSTTRAASVSHPENFIRARAVWLWHSKGAEAEPAIRAMIEGQTGLDELDLFKQQNITRLTEMILQEIMHKSWMQTPQTISLAKQYFGSLDWGAPINKESLKSQLETLHPNLKDYLAYVLYDFSTVDKELEDVPLGYCFFLADELMLQEAFLTAVKKERKLTDKKAATLKKAALASFHQQSLELA